MATQQRILRVQILRMSGVLARVLRVARTCQTRRHSPKAIFEKNVTRLDKLARVTRKSHEFGASGHSLEKSKKI